MSLATLEARLAEGTLTRKQWEGHDDKGRHLACLYYAYVEGIDGVDPTKPAACPSHLMPAWWAEITSWIDDAGSEAAWPGVVRRWVACAKRWSAFRPADWALFSRRVRTIIIREARSNCPADATDVLAVCDRVLSLLARDDATPAEFEAAWAAAAATWTVRAVRTKATAAGKAAAWAAAWRSWAVMQAARAAGEARTASSDRMIDAILTELESMLDSCEARNAAEIAES